MRIRGTARKIGASVDHDWRPHARPRPRTLNQAVVEQTPVSAQDPYITSAARPATGADPIVPRVGAGPRDVIPDRMHRPIKCDVCPVTSYTSHMTMVKAVETASSEQQLGDQLRDVRMRQGFSVRALAARAGCSPSFVSQVEHGQASPSISSLEGWFRRSG